MGGASETVLHLHSGIHAGLVLLIEGDIERGRVDVVGQVPNTAARLCSLAAAGEILVSEETLGPQAHFFRFTSSRQLQIKGRAEALNVLRIKGRASVKRRIDAAARRGVVPFVGRNDALAALTDAAGRARQGAPVVVVVSGEPGIGKTRLIAEFVGRLDPSEFRMVQGYCETYLGAESLQPFKLALRGALGWRADASPEDNESAISSAMQAFGQERVVEFAPLMRALSGRRAGAPDEVPAPIRIPAVVDFIGLLARSGTLVLALDDWQWADDASRRVLEGLRERRLPLLIVLATRTNADEDSATPGAQTLRLPPLNAVEAEGAIASWLPGTEPFVAQEIYHHSGGSPLFIEELCHAAAAGDIRSTPRGVGVTWLNALVASRLERLPEDQAECLRIASVAGNTFAAWLLERLTGARVGAPLFEALAAEDFLVPGGQPGMLRFKHALTREAVYATVDLARRRTLHLQVAEALEASVKIEGTYDWLEALSYHYDAAGKTALAARFAEAAGDKALASQSLDRARAHYIAALRSMDAMPDLQRMAKLRWCGIAQKLGQACVFDPLDVSQGLALFERAAYLARETGDENVIARAEYWLGYINYSKGRPRTSIRHCEAALSYAIASDDQRLVAQVQATLGQALASAGRYEHALPLLSQAVESKRQQSRPGSGAAIGSAYTLARTAYTLGDLGRFDEAEDVFEEALRLVGESPHTVGSSVRELICAVHLWQGRWEEAYKEGTAGAEIGKRCHSRYMNAMGRALAACGTWALHQDAESLRALRESTHWIEARGGAISTSLNYGWLVEATATLGLKEEARQHAAKLFLRARAQDRHGEAMGCRALAHLASSGGDQPRAEHYLDTADRAAEFRASPRERAVNWLARGEVAAMGGRTADARALAESAGEAFEAMKMAWHASKARELIRRL
ncbi:MAG: AAA family ATPase [Betaproteobacteria bacterium]